MKIYNPKITLLIVAGIIFVVRAASQVTSQSEPFPSQLENPYTINVHNDSKRMNHILEFSHGQAFTEWTDAWAWFFFGNYLFQVSRNIAVGAGTGLQFDWSGLYPALSANSIFGNKTEGFAAGLDIKFIFTGIIESPGERFWVALGGYYKNFFIKLMPTFVVGYPEEWYVETGYSFTIKR